MADNLEHVDLRELLQPLIIQLKHSYTHKELPALCQRLGLPQPPPQENHEKADRLQTSFDALTDANLPQTTEAFLRQECLEAQERHALEDALWNIAGPVEISQRVRREITAALDLEDLTQHPGRFMNLLHRFWLPEENLWPPEEGEDSFTLLSLPGPSLRSQIEKHVLRNPGDWSTEELFERLGVFTSPHPRFTRFLQRLVSAELVPDESTQRRLVAAINPCLRSAGVELHEVGLEDGYPLFEALPTGQARNRRPRNLVFASTKKPDLRFRDAIDNDVESVDDQEHVLFYDRSIGPDGIRWQDLQDWWKQDQGILEDSKAKETLYRRLGESLPPNSPAQRNFYVLYHQIFDRDIPGLPALLPEVWLHWDPRTIQQRGSQALPWFRMDFLMLLPHGQRVVMEVDGSQHFTDRAKYAADMRADRTLKLRGYEVFRFGTEELEDSERAEVVLKEFFVSLFRRFDVLPSGRVAPV